MSFESWASCDEVSVRCRLPACGHTVYLHGTFDSTFECSTCGDWLPEQSGLAVRDYVPSADMTWEGATCRMKTCLQLEDVDLGGISIRSVEGLVAALCSPKVHRLRLRTAPLRPKTPFLAPRGNSCAVWRAPTVGCTVHGGTVELPERGVLLLAGAGAHFHDTTFKGGVVMCAGPQFSGTFQDCTFLSSTMYAVHGAAVTLRACAILHSHLGLALNGRATSATLDHCTFRRCRTSIVVEAGAAIETSDCCFLRTEFPVIVNEDGSHAALEACEAQGSYEDNHPFGGIGVSVRRGAATLRGCMLTRFGSAVYADSSRVELQGVQIVDSVHGVFARCCTLALMRDCDFRMSAPGPRDPVAVSACGAAGSEARGRLQLERCTVSDCVPETRALVIDDGSAAAATLCRFVCTSEVASVGVNDCGGRATLEHCTAESPLLCLLVNSPAGRMRLKGGRYKGDMTACAAQNGATLTATDCEFRGHDGPQAPAGVQFHECVGVVRVLDAAQALFRDCRVHGGIVGVLISRATATAVDTCVCDVLPLLAPKAACSTHAGDCCDGGGGAAFTCVSGRLVVRGGGARRCVVGVEADTGEEDAPSAVTLDGAEFTDCFMGASFQHPCSVDVKHCVFRGLEGERKGVPGLEALHKAGDHRHKARGAASLALHCLHASVQHCSISGFTGSLEDLLDGADVCIRNCDVTIACDKGAGMILSATAAVEDCVFRSSGGKGVCGILANETATCVVRRCRFQGLSLVAIEAHDNASVSVVDSVVAGPCSNGFVARHQAQIAAQDCRVVDTVVAVNVAGSAGAFNGKRVTLQGIRTNVLLEAAPHADEGGRRAVKLVDCVLTGAERGVWAGDAVADLSFVRCRISATDTGVFVTGPVKARIKGGSISGGLVGVSVGDVVNAYRVPCKVCGLSGEKAMHAAAEAAVDTFSGGIGGGSVVAARCTHEGASARLVLADCEVVQCSNTGVHVILLGRVVASGVTARDCGRGFLVDLSKNRCSFEGCRAFGCRIGSRQGWSGPLGCVDLLNDAVDNTKPIPGVEVLPS